MHKPKSPLTGLIRRVNAAFHDHGIKVTAQLLFWSLRTGAQKRWIAYQDQKGLFPYKTWHKISQPGRQTLIDQRTNSSSFKNTPLISVLIASQGHAPEDLEETLKSLVAQSYPHWEAVIADSEKKTGGELQSLVNQYSKNHSVARSGSKKESVLDAFPHTSGELVQVLRAGDQLAPDALYEITRAFNDAENCDIIYSDEDELSGDGASLQNPFFKPDWSPELFISINYLDGAWIRRDLLQTSLEISQAAGEQVLTFEDLLFQAVGQARNIHHIPKVLRHLAKPSSQKTNFGPGSDKFQQRILSHCQKIGLPDPEVTCTDTGNIRVGWAPSGRKVSIIIPTTDHISLLKQCLTSIEAHTRYPSYEVVLVDSGSQAKETLDYYAELKNQQDIHILYNKKNFNFSGALNLGARHAQGEIFLFLNNDTEIIEPGWLTELVRWADRPEVGVVGGKLLFPNGTIQHAGIVFGLEGHASHVFGGEEEGQTGAFGSVDWYRNYMAVTAACMAIRRDVFEEIGGFDEDYLLVFSDIELCLRAYQAGYRLVYTPYTRLIHHEGKTRFRHIPTKDILLATNHFKDLVTQGDPYYNPNLSHTVRNPTLRRPWEELPIARLIKITQWRGGVGSKQ